MPVRSSDGAHTVWATVDQVTDTEYSSIQQELLAGLNNRRHFEAIGHAFEFALNLCPRVNPSDVWQHIIYRTYLTTGRSEQSWKRASGQAFENAFVRLYNPRLYEHDIRLVVLSPSQTALALREMEVHRQVGHSKLDIALQGVCESDRTWRVFGGVHAKVSIAERISDDEPASRAMIANGYLSVIATLDSKSFPPPGGDGVNRGELGFPRPGHTADKRDYVEVHGSFHMCFSYNLRSPPSTGNTPSGGRIYSLSFSEPQPDQFVTCVTEYWNTHRQDLCGRMTPSRILAH